MSEPNDPGRSEPPPQGPYPGQPQPPGYGPPPEWQAPPQYGPPQYGEPQYPPQYPPSGQQYGPPPPYAPQTPQLGPPPGWYGPQDGQYGPPPELLQPQPPRSHGRGKVVALAAAVVVLLGGGVATYAAVSSSSAPSGSATPQAAVQKILGDLNSSDLLGMLDDLPPGERDAIVEPVRESVSDLQRDGVLSPSADLNHLSGVTVHTSNVTFAPQTVAINDHVRIVELTGGSLTLSADATKLPIAGDLLRIMAAHASGPTSVHHTVNLARAVRAEGRPIRIATQQVGGQWYPSLLYTIADNATVGRGAQPPTAAEAIPARGAGSADDAVRQMIGALMASHLRRAIELTSPDEDAVLHDYGALFIRGAHYSPPPVRLNHLSFVDKPMSGGTQVTLRSVTATEANGQQVTVMESGGCVEVKGMGQDQRLCRGEIGSMLANSPMPAAERVAVQHVMSGFQKLGIMTSESGGQWYVNPLRTMLDIGPALLSGLTRSDFQHLIQLGR